MPSLKGIRKRIVSVKNTQKITKAMKMVAAAKLRHAQNQVQAMRPYARRMKKVAEDLARTIVAEVERHAAQDGALGEERTINPALLLRGTQAETRIRVVVVTSDRGLAGAFNSSITRRTERFLVERSDAQIDLDILGKKGRDVLRRRKVTIKSEMAGADPKSAARLSHELAVKLSEAVEAREVDAVYVVYNEFKNATSQTVKVERLLPIEPPPKEPERGRPQADEAPQTLVEFAYEPSKDKVLAHLVPLYIETELQRIFLESIASEFGARMSAMDNASRNAKEMISRLTLQYNRARQAAITKELMEIVGGAEALKG